MSKIQQIVQAQIYLPDGLSDKAQLQMLVYREGCDGETSYTSIDESRLVALLNELEAQ